MDLLTIVSFLFFTGLVAFLTWRMTRGEDTGTSDGFFLGGRSLTFPLIAGSLMLTNLSTEQLVGLNGGAFDEGLVVMVWEIFAVIALVAMALFFLPKFLKSGITTVPEFLALRFDKTTQAITNFIFLAAYALLLLPIILYTGATGMIGILGTRPTTRSAVSDDADPHRGDRGAGRGGLRAFRRAEIGGGIGYAQRHRAADRRADGGVFRTCDGR